MKTYKILWIDDQYDLLDNFQLKAERKGILLEGFKSFDEGFAYLDKHFSDFSGVLLDARFFASRDDQPGDEDLKGLRLAVSRLDQLHSRKKLPWFILSGQADLERNSFFIETYGKYYVKFDEASEQALFIAIKDAADQITNTRIRHQYADAFSVFTPQLLGERPAIYLLQILECLDEPMGKPEPDSYLNQLRKLVEALLYGLHQYQLLPGQCLKNTEVNLTSSHIFLSGREMRNPDGSGSVKLRHHIMPSVLADSLRNLVELTSNGSHYLQDQQITPSQRQIAKEKLLQLRQQVKTPYLLASLTYQLLDLLVWFKNIIGDAALTTHQNNWVTAGPGVSIPIAGKIEKISPRGGAIFRADFDGVKASVPPVMVTNNSLTEGQSVHVVIHDLISVRSLTI